MSAPVTTHGAWRLDVMAAAVWGLLAGLSAVAVMPYLMRGIEMAMLGHFSADIVLHVLAPLASVGATA